MPRAKKDPYTGGQPNGKQPVVVPTGRPYGEAQKLQQAQQAVPLPQSQPPAADPMAAAIETAAPIDFGLGGLFAETERPDEPLTAGVGIGPGPGPVEQPASRLALTLDRMAEATGDPWVAQLAQRARARGL